MSPKLSKGVTAKLQRFLDSPAVRTVTSNPDDAPRADPPANATRKPQRRTFKPPSRGYPSSEQLALPAQVHRARILAAITEGCGGGHVDDGNEDGDGSYRSNFTLLMGATGCGKSTQLPQLLLTENDTNGKERQEQTVIVVAQPRRLAAVSLAQRVSQELRKELGREVGYIIRGENRTCDDTVCTFVTYGVLLKMLLDGGGGGGGAEVLPGVTHLLLDEVHERSADLDLILLFLKERFGPAATATGNKGTNQLSVTLMSATVDPEAFVSYLPGVKVVSVEGRSYPVTRLYLEDAVRDAAYVGEGKTTTMRRRRAPLSDDALGQTDEERQIAELTDAIQGEDRPEAVATLAARRDKLVARAEHSKAGGVGSPTVRVLGAMSLAETQSRFRLENVAVARALRSMDYDAIPNGLIGRLVECHVKTADGGDVLVFLPGVGEIEALRTQLLEDTARRLDLHVLALHANVQARDQLAAFEPPPPGKTKVILATAIAEASITIPTVTLVIDAGLARCVLLDPATSLPNLTTVLAAQSSLKQRAGRAGRVREGRCYHLIISPLLSELDTAPVPEMLTMPLETISLRARVALEAANGIDAGTTSSILGGVISPPPPEPCRVADALLVAAGAVDGEDMALTKHGRTLASTPLSLSHASALVGSHRFGPRVFDDMAFLLAALNSTASRPRWAELEAKLKKSATSDHIALLGQVKSDARVRKEADRLKQQAVAKMGPPPTIAAVTDSSGTMHLVLACLLSSSSQVGKFANSAITYATEVRTHTLRPHRSSICSTAKNAGGYAYFGDIIKLPAGPVVSDVSIVSGNAAEMFATHSFSAEEGSKMVLKQFGERVKNVFLGREELSREMLLLLQELLGDLVPPWDGLPSGWIYDDESKVFRTMKGEISQRKKPKQPAKVALMEKEKAKGSLESAESLLGRKKGCDRGEGPALITASKSSSAKSKLDLSDEGVKIATLARAKQAEEGERKRSDERERKGGVSRMVAELSLSEKYAGAFEASGVNNAMLEDISMMMKGDEDDKAEAQKGIEEIIRSCRLVGGSAVKVRKYLEGGGKETDGNAKREGKKEHQQKLSQAPAAKPGNAKTKGKTKKKKSGDLSSLDDALGGGGAKAKSRSGKKR